MKSVRLDPELQARLEEAALIRGQPVSQIIREAVRRCCDEIMGDRLDRRLADVVGSVAGRGGSSRRTGEAFLKVVKKKHTRRRP